MGSGGQVEKDKISYVEMDEWCNNLLQQIITAEKETQLYTNEGSKNCCQRKLFSNVLEPAVILDVFLVYLGTENCQKPSNAFFFGPELIYVGKSFQQKILEQLIMYSGGKLDKGFVSRVFTYCI